MRADRWRQLAGALLALWLVLPLVPLAIWSFAHGWRFPDLLPQAWSLKAWAQALSPASGVLHSLALTTLIALATTALALVVALPANQKNLPTSGGAKKKNKLAKKPERGG